MNPENSVSFNPALWLRFFSPGTIRVAFCYTQAYVKIAFDMAEESFYYKWHASEA